MIPARRRLASGCASSNAATIRRQYPGLIAGEVTDRRVDLRKGNLHAMEVTGRSTPTEKSFRQRAALGTNDGAAGDLVAIEPALADLEGETNLW